MIEIHLPYPPSANRLWTIAGKGERKWQRKTDEYNAWLDDAGWMAKPQLKGRVIVGPYKLSIQAIRPDKRRRDIDNLIKPVSDLMQHIGVIGNDCDCEMVSARWVTTGSPLTARIEPAGVE